MQCYRDSELRGLRWEVRDWRIGDREIRGMKIISSFLQMFKNKT